jgi:hypothetical protein
MPAALKIQPISSTTSGQDAESDTRDCTLADGTSVRLRWGADQPFPFGECGAAPPEHVTLWVDKRRVLHHFFISDGCRGISLRSIDVDGKSVRLCAYVPKDAKTRQDMPDDAPVATTLPANGREGRAYHVRCRDKPVDRSTPIDTVEYPGSTVADRVSVLKPVIQEDALLCEAAVSADGKGVVRPPHGVPVKWQSWTKPPSCGATQRATFDFFNEGTERDVYDWSLCPPAPDGEMFLMLPKGSPAPEPGLAEAVADHGKTLSLPPGGRLQDLGRWHAEVFRYGNETYVLATPTDPQQDFYLWRPLADGSRHVACSWRTKP